MTGTIPTERVAALIARDLAAQDAGIRLRDAAEGSVRIEMTTEPRMGNGHATVHGGWLFLLADTAAAYVMATDTDDAVTISGDIVFHAPADVGQTLVAHARREHRAGATVVLDVAVESSDGVRVASARFTGRQRRPAS